MSIEKKIFEEYIKNFQFRDLFNEMGWDNDAVNHSIVVDDTSYKINSVATKEGFRILVCDHDNEGQIPPLHVRKKIGIRISKFFHENLLIFQDESKYEQIWQLVIRSHDKPSKISWLRYNVNQSPDLLYQKASGLFFRLEEEGNVTIVDVKKRISENYNQNNEKVTKQFYEKFKKEHNAFLSFIKGINNQVNCEWYASLMLNRLMFCYFIQKKGYLDDNKNYLRDKLKECQAKQGKNKFYSFYRNFLLELFHQGLGSSKRNKELEIQIGKVPYLNGGLFDEHELEKTYQGIDITDKAFEAIFDFFDEYEWHLDTRTTASGKDINPDVVGYIFEKYINDRAQMGAYYTKEDITEYISKNTILPYLYSEVQRQYPIALESNSEIWKLLQSSCDEYIYPAIKHGVDETLPDEIAKGIKDVNQRTEWNKAAPDTHALPTEIWREVIDRRNRYEDIKRKITNGEINQINDFITYNLNIRQFTQDLLETTEDAELIQYFYKSLVNITILDPTCGSGAFLFAAMNILEPLYETCIKRMQDFIELGGKRKYKYFDEVLEQVHSVHHPNLEYFIYKTIILRNLYGVDIMKEAVEIAKLRLFLKLVATVDVDRAKANLGLEPLPDIDFNIRSGNTLIGFINKEEIQEAINKRVDSQNIQMGFIFDDKAKKLEHINEQAEIVAKAFDHYKTIQLSWGEDPHSFAKAKGDLQTRLNDLKKILDEYLALTYNIDAKAKPKEYEVFIETHQPFHWFAEFYEMIQLRNGFDVIIGNPPYVEIKKISYKLNNYKTIACGNLYALVIERYFNFISNKGRSGMIIPHSSICTDRMESLQELLSKVGAWYSTYDIRPSKLFNGVDQRLLIYLTDFSFNGFITSKYYRWSSEFREFLFKNIEYVSGIKGLILNSIIKAGKNIENSIYRKLIYNSPINKLIVTQKETLFYHNAPRYFIRFMGNAPYFYNDKKGEIQSNHVKKLYFGNNCSLIGAILNSNLYYWYFIKFSNCRDLVERDILSFPFSLEGLKENIRDNLEKLYYTLGQDYEKNKVRKKTYYKSTGNVVYDEYYPKKSKHIIDEIDRILAKHYGFTEEETDFIINYDIKYRMGKELEDDNDED